MLKIQAFTTKLSGAMKGLSAAQKLATITQTAFNTSLLACPITWIAVGIGAVVGGVLAWKKHMEKADIAKHFGDITLSAEECSEIVKGVFGSEFLSKVDSVNSATEDFKQSLERTAESAKKLNKLNFQIQFGSDISQEDYMAAVDEYVANLQATVSDKQYSLSLNIDLLFDNSEFGNAFSSDANGYYGQLSEQASKLGEDLKAAAKNAYEHNWDLDSTEAVAAIMKQQAEIQEKIATAQSEAKLETFKYDFTTGDLSQESFQNLIEATNTELDNLKETYNQARIDAIAAAELMYPSDSNKRTKAIDEANQAYSEKMASLNVKGLRFENEAIISAYSEEFTKAAEAAGGAFDTSLFWENINQKLASGEDIDAVQTAQMIQDELVSAFTNSDISDATRKHIGEFFEKMMPTVEELKKNMQGIETVPEEYASVYAQSNIIGALGKNTTAFKNVSVTTLSTLLPDEERKILEGSKKLVKVILKELLLMKILQKLKLLQKS